MDDNILHFFKQKKNNQKNKQNGESLELTENKRVNFEF